MKICYNTLSKHSSHFILIASLLLAGCDEPPTGTDDECLTTDGDVLFPMSEGNYWTSEQLSYSDGQIEENRRDTGKVVIEKMMTIQFEGTLYEVGVRNLHYPIDYPSEVNWLFWNGPDGLYVMGGMTDTDTFSHPVLELKYPVEIGQSWQVPRMFYYWEDQKFGFIDTLTYTLVATDESYETPLGTFQCVVYYFYIKPAKDVLSNWHYFTYYAPGIGKVGNLIYSSPDTTYNYNNRDIYQLTWKTTVFDYCLK